MFIDEDEIREVEQEDPEVDEEPDDSEPLDLEEDDDDADAEVALAEDDDEEDDEASLEELLAQRAAARRGADETDDDDIMSLASEANKVPLEPLPTRVIPIKDRQEFVCNRCHLVKARSQLADADRGLCRDCV